MSRFAIVENISREVVNCVVWEGYEWLPPRNHWVIRSDVANIGDKYDEKTNTFISSQIK